MTVTTRTSYQAIIGFLCGLISTASGFLAIVAGTDAYLLAVLAFGALAFAFGILGRRAVQKSPERLSGAGLAAWGMAMPIVAVVLGFLLLPAT